MDEEFWKKPTVLRKKGCPVCGEKTEVDIQIIIAQKDGERRSGTTKTRGTAYCENHGIEMWKELVKQVGKEII